MIIESVTLKNYRQYRKKITIDLSISSQKNINVIIGSNGAGKTNLSNAIQWCLYGKEPSLKEGVGFGILNMVEFDSLKEGEMAEVLVEVVISYNNERYSIRRTQTIQKNKGKQEVIPIDDGEPDGSKLKAYFHGTVKIKPSIDPDFPGTLINILAPEKISDYFFFDGEKLDKYFADSPMTRIQEAIFQISQLDLLAKIEDRLNNVIKDYRDEAKGIMPELANIEGEIRSIGQKLDENKIEITNKEVILDKLRKEKKELLMKYAEFGGENAKKILIKNEEIEKEMEQNENDLMEKENEKINCLVNNGYLFFAMDALQYSLKLFTKARKDGIFPPNIDPKFVQELLDEGYCICKTGISAKNKNKEPRKNVEELFKKISTGLGSRAGELMEKETDISHIKDSKLKFFINEIKTINKSIQDYTVSIDRLKKELENNKSLIKRGAELSKIENFESTINKLDYEIEALVGAIAVLKAQKTELDSELKGEKEEFKKQADKEDKGKKINNFIHFCEEAVKQASGIKSTILNEIRQEISDETEKHYKELHWKKEKINILINEDYKIFALQNGHDKFGSFAAGERALLAMSFLIALNHVSGFNVPIIMDTALGRISTEPRKQFSENITNYLKENQIILLFTESEFSPEVKKNLMPFINHQYVIKLQSPLEADFVEKKE